MTVQVNSIQTVQNSKSTTAANSSSSSMPVKNVQLTQTPPVDTFEKTNKDKNNKKKLLIGVGALLVTIIGIIVTKNVMSKRKAAKALAEDAEQKAQELTERAKTEPEAPKTEEPKPVEPKTPEIKKEKNGDPKAIIGCDADEAKALLKEYEENQKHFRNTKPFAETNAESDEASQWYRKVCSPLMDKIRNYNISLVKKKQFLLDQVEQVKEKHDYIQNEVMPYLSENESCYYDGLEEFEKYGKREEYQNSGISTLLELTTWMPKNPTEKTVNKFMDIFKKHAIYDPFIDDKGTGRVDGTEYIAVISKPGILRTEAQVEKAYEIGKRFIWDQDALSGLGYTLQRAPEAPFKNNKKVEQIMEQFYKAAYDNRTPYKDTDWVKNYEESRNIKRDY